MPILILERNQSRNVVGITTDSFTMRIHVRNLSFLLPGALSRPRQQTSKGLNADQTDVFEGKFPVLAQVMRPEAEKRWREC
jgi:hypothetical protein